MPYGPSSAPSAFQKIISSVLSGIDGCINLLDDIVIHGRSKDQHDKRLQLVLDRLAEYHITLNPNKCQFARKEIDFLGYHVSPQGVLPLYTNGKTREELPQPTSAKEAKNLPEPHGECVSGQPLEYFHHYSLSACKFDCLTRFVVARCRCRAAHMPEKTPGYPPVCDIRNYVHCYLPTVVAMSDPHIHTRDEFRLYSDECACPVPCEEIHYESSITYASTSGRNINAPSGGKVKSDLRAKYVRARETEQRVRRDIVDTDTEIINALSRQLHELFRVSQGVFANTDTELNNFVA
ncbi:hypothetical protein LSAT2_005732 [Lamellibrachia satsuma]|nr:hypothetical protein LSAT2_005732 [Lamellibrachia satsuma]